MRQLFILILFVFNLTGLRAEYTACRLQLKIKTTDKEYIGFIETYSSINLDLANDLGYLKSRLPRKENKKGIVVDSILFYQYKIVYEHNNLSIGAGKKSENTKLVDPIHLHIDSVIDISIVNIEKFFYGTAVISTINVTDTIWLKASAKSEIFVDGDICNYEIFIHESSLEVDSIINRMKTIRSKYPNDFAELSTKAIDGGGNVGDELDRKLRIEINKLIRLSLKIVVIETCMC